MPTKFKERRQHQRVSMRVFVRLSAGNTSQRYVSKDISAGGIFLLSDKPLAAKTKVEVELLLPDLSAPVKAKAEVVWNRKLDPSGFAIKFTEISEVSREFIRWAINR